MARLCQNPGYKVTKMIKVYGYGMWQVNLFVIEKGQFEGKNDRNLGSHIPEHISNLTVAHWPHMEWTWILACGHPAINWTYVDSSTVKSSDIHMGPISQ